MIVLFVKEIEKKKLEENSKDMEKNKNTELNKKESKKKWLFFSIEMLSVSFW